MSRQDQLGARGTRVETAHGCTFVWYHGTPVAAFGDKEIILTTNGWYTPTTKTRMNQASAQFNLGFQVFQKKWQWYVAYKNGPTLTFPPSGQLVLAR